MRQVAPAIRFAIDYGGLKHPVAKIGREVEIGAFRIELSSTNSLDLPRRSLVEIRKLADSDREGALSHALDAVVLLRASEVVPAGQDPVASTGLRGQTDSRLSPLLFRLDTDEPTALPGTPEPYVLKVHETLDRGQDHAVELSLTAEGDRSADDVPRSVLVLDPRPFRVNAVRYRSLASARSGRGQ